MTTTAYNTYDADLTGSSFENILTQTEHILEDNAGFLEFCNRNSNALKSGGLKDMRVYRTAFCKKYLENKTPLDRSGFLAVVAATSVVQTKSRVMRVVKGLDSPAIQTAATKILGDFRDKRAQTNDIDTFLVVNLRTAFPDLIMLVRMVNSDLLSNSPFTNDAGNKVNVKEWYRSPCFGQLALDKASQDQHREYMQYFWTNEVTGSGSGWNADSEAWYNRTTATDQVRLPDIGTVTAKMSGADDAGTASTRYTTADVQAYATALHTYITAAAPVAAGNAFAPP